MRRAFAAAAILWAIALPLATFVVSRSPALPLANAFALAMYQSGSIICHQIPVRSFHLWSVKMPVCARCTGIYVGAACLGLYSLFAFRPVGDRTARWLVALAMMPSAITLVYEWTTGIMPANAIRALAGFPIGAAIAMVVVWWVPQESARAA